MITCPWQPFVHLIGRNCIQDGSFWRWFLLLKDADNKFLYMIKKLNCIQAITASNLTKELLLHLKMFTAVNNSFYLKKQLSDYNPTHNLYSSDWSHQRLPFCGDILFELPCLVSHAPTALSCWIYQIQFELWS